MNIPSNRVDTLPATLRGLAKEGISPGWTTDARTWLLTAADEIEHANEAAAVLMMERDAARTERDRYKAALDAAMPLVEAYAGTDSNASEALPLAQEAYGHPEPTEQQAGGTYAVRPHPEATRDQPNNVAVSCSCGFGGVAVGSGGECPVCGLRLRPAAVVAGPDYPTDRDIWICSVCSGWNWPQDRHCTHRHADNAGDIHGR